MNYLSSYSAKVIAYVLVIFFIIFHGFLHIEYGNNSCDLLLTNGHIQDENWQPNGCMLHNYTQTDARQCMRSFAYWSETNYIVFMGDSRIREQYYTFVNLIGVVQQEKTHSNIYFSNRKLNLRVHFIWNPFVDSRMAEIYKSWLEKDAPSFLITGSATWNIKQNNATLESFQNYTSSLYNISSDMLQLANSSRVIWMLQDPVYENKLNKSRSMITNDVIEDYNNIAIDLFGDSKVKVWGSSRMISQYFIEQSLDGLHQSSKTLSIDSQVLYNYYCNVQMNFKNGSCCNKLEKITIIQVITGFIFITILIVFISVICCQYTLFKQAHAYQLIAPPMASPRAPFASPGSDHSADLSPPRLTTHRAPFAYANQAQTLGFFPFLKAISQLALIMFYFFLCDRTYFFMQENKSYTRLNFIFPFIYILILGIFFSENAKEANILNRDQIIETRGWMITLVLIYQMTGASEMLAFYIQIRIIITFYLFLSLFGHFSYLWNTGDFCLYRICKILFRLNFLVITLCFVMNRPYQFYYFVPYASLCMVLMYSTMAVYPRIVGADVDRNFFLLIPFIFKFAVLTVLLSFLHSYEFVFENIFLSFPMKALFVTSDDSISTWRDNMIADLYIVIYSALISLTYLVLKSKMTDFFLKRIVLVIVAILTVIFIITYGVLIRNATDNDSYNKMHTYISMLPILSYVSLRNLIPVVRTNYSTFFTWIGHISLELCATQSHLWLSGNSQGVLVLIPGDTKILNVLLTTFIFVCTSHQLHGITETLAVYAIPNNNKLLLRNTVMFAAILFPIAISNGLIL